MRVRSLLLVTQASTMLAGLLLVGGVAALPTTTPAALTAAPAPAPAPPAVVHVTSVRPVTKGLKPKPRPTAVQSSRPKRVKPAPVRVARKAVPLRRSAPVLTPRQRLERAVAQIPGYRQGSVDWRLEAKDGYWGTADWYRDIIWISPRVPERRLYSVVVHEWSHVQSVQPYGGDVDLAVREMARFFGGSDLVGAERAADCMALLRGANWTHYTPCPNATWRAGAARLLAGKKL
ncbi:MAG: hypothetical protein JWN87_1253 [Frankiales bacterium]|nr:hypothetical protein [Frankiales bacterium]